MGEGIRWRIARLLDKLPGQCWADLVGWVQGDRGGPWSPNVDCHRSAVESRHGACYCGKIRQPEPAATGGERS